MDRTVSVLRDVLRVYDHRFLDLEPPQRARLVEGTRRVLAEDGLGADAHAGLPAAYRLRAFCIRNGMSEELEKLIRDEVDGSEAGAVVVGGRVYALYPYLRGVPRQDADITDEVGVAHRLDAVAWRGRDLRIRGRAAIERVAARASEVEVGLRERDSGEERWFPAVNVPGGFEADLAAGEPGRWDVHVAVSTLGVRREARLGPVCGERLDTGPHQRTLDAATEATAYFTRRGHLCVEVQRDERPAPLRTRLRRRLRAPRSARK